MTYLWIAGLWVLVALVLGAAWAVFRWERQPKALCPQCGDGPYELPSCGWYECECGHAWRPN